MVVQEEADQTIDPEQRGSVVHFKKNDNSREFLHYIEFWKPLWSNKINREKARMKGKIQVW